MKDPIPGLTGAPHATLTGPTRSERAEDTEDAPPITPEEAPNVYGKKPICNVCKHQIRPLDEPTNTGCSNDAAEFQSELCTAYEPVSHEQLAARFVILDNLVSIVWDVCLILLDRSGALPKVPE